MTRLAPYEPEEREQIWVFLGPLHQHVGANFRLSALLLEPTFLARAEPWQPERRGESRAVNFCFETFAKMSKMLNYGFYRLINSGITDLVCDLMRR